MHVRIFSLALLLLVLGIGQAGAACTTYETPRLIHAPDFLDKSFGTLAMYRPGATSRMFLFDRSSCYDVAFLNLTELKLFLNNKDANEKPSFLAANVIRAYDYDMAGEPPFQIKFRRNGNSSDSIAKWVRVKDEEQLQEGGSFNGSRAIVLDGDLELPHKWKYSELSEFVAARSLTDKTVSGWHAIIAATDANDAHKLERDGIYNVVENTRFGIDPIGIEGFDFSAAPKVTVISQMQLIKFQRLAQPTRPIFALDTEPRSASCLYLRYRIDGSTDVFLDPGNTPGDYLVLRLKANAAC